MTDSSAGSIGVCFEAAPPRVLCSFCLVARCRALRVLILVNDDVVEGLLHRAAVTDGYGEDR
jgi:hypothetical protein